MNKKGFTVIELIISFAFVSALTASLFTLVLNYRDKEQAAADIVKINNFKNVISTVIQRDIETKILKKAEYCTNAGVYVNRCINLIFRDGTSKQLQIAYSEETANVYTSTLKYYKYYIIYDDVLYTVPAEGNIEVRADYMLNYTTRDDAIENKVGLYRINLNFYHKNLDVDAEVKITAMGEGYAKTGAGDYKAYNIGDAVRVQVNSACTYHEDTATWTCSAGESYYENFHVIVPSDQYDRKVTLFADKNYGSSKMYEDTDHILTSNTFEDTMVYNELTSLYNKWTSIEQRSDIRLISANELSILAGTPMQARFFDVHGNISLGSLSSTTSNFIPSSDGNNFWTSSPYLTPGKQTQMWIFKNNKLHKANMTDSYNIRPVIRVDKVYVLTR